MVVKKKRHTGHYRDEFRPVAAVYIYTAVHSKKSMQHKDQTKLMEVMFHGTETRASHQKMVANGEGKLVCYWCHLLQCVLLTLHFSFCHFI